MRSLYLSSSFLPLAVLFILLTLVGISSFHDTLPSVSSMISSPYQNSLLSYIPTPLDQPFVYDLNGIWIKHDRAVNETFHLNFECTECCSCVNDPIACNKSNCLPQYSTYYLDGPFAGQLTFNVTMVGDLMSGTGQYANFGSVSPHPLVCPAPFALIITFDPNVVLVSYGATFGTQCGDYTGDSAVYYRKQATHVKGEKK